jgi:glycosyltransferase involved in cell wall biosynthesis
MERTVIHHADLVLASSHATAAFCAQRYDYPLAEISVIHSGIDTARFLPLPQPRDERHPKILFVGRLIEQKGIKELVRAVLKLKARYPKICLRAIGKEDRELLMKLEKQIAAADAKTNFEFKGYVPYGELADHYAWCDFFAGPSAYEPGPGNIYLEAMACGRPVIACNTGGAPEVVRHQERGLLVPPGDVKSLRKAIVKLTEDVELRERLGNNGRAWVEENVSIEKYTGKVERLYEESIAEINQVT